jgi:predicted membrane chloride channel (bestrophin family)
MVTFNITSATLGLLLVFRTNTSYSRWDEARKMWGLVVNRTRFGRAQPLICSRAPRLLVVCYSWIQ